VVRISTAVMVGNTTLLHITKLQTMELENYGTAPCSTYQEKVRLSKKLNALNTKNPTQMSTK